MIEFRTSASPEVSVIMLVTRETALVQPNLEALALALPEDVATEVVIVLNTSRPDTRALVLDGVRGATVVDSPANCGTAAGWNVAIGASRGARVAIIHEDTRTRAGWLEPLVDALASDRRALFSCSRIVNTDGSIWNCGWIIWRDGVTTTLDERSAPELMRATEPYHVDAASSASMLIDRATFMAVGGFEERTFPTVTTNMDLALAGWHAGHTACATPRSSVVHATHAMVHAERGLYSSTLFREFLIRRATERLRAKWGDELDARYLDRDPAAPLDDPAEHERALAATAARAATPSPDPPPTTRQTRELTAPDGGWPDRFDAGAKDRLLEAQREVDRAFDQWVLDDREALRARILELDAGAREATQAHDNALAVIDRLGGQAAEAAQAHDNALEIIARLQAQLDDRD